MRKLCVTAAMVRYASDARDGRGVRRSGGVLLVPQILDPETWERLATAQQQELLEQSREDRTAGVVLASGESEIEASRKRQADHRDAVRQAMDQARLGGLDYVRHKEAQVRRLTR